MQRGVKTVTQTIERSGKFAQQRVNNAFIIPLYNELFRSFNNVDNVATTPLYIVRLASHFAPIMSGLNILGISKSIL